MDPNNYGVNYKRYKYVDFSYPVMKTAMSIISVRTSNTGKIVDGVFDNLSYGLIFASVFMSAFILWAMQFRNKKRRDSLLEAFLLTTGLLLRQYADTQNSKFYIARIKHFIAFIAIMMTFLSTMYNCVVISILTSGSGRIFQIAVSINYR